MWHATAYMAVHWICWIWAIIDQLTILSHGKKVIGLEGLFATVSMLYGFFNFLIYCSFRRIWRKYYWEDSYAGSWDSGSRTYSSRSGYSEAEGPSGLKMSEVFSEELEKDSSENVETPHFIITTNNTVKLPLDSEESEESEDSETSDV